MNFKKQNIVNRNVIASTLGCAAIASLLLLAACGDDSSSNSSDNEIADEDYTFTLEELEEMGVSIFDSADKLGDCSDKNEFETVYVKADSSFYICDEGKWSNDFSVETEIVESKDKLGECNEENDGQMFRVPRDTIYDTYSCEDGEWVSDFGGSAEPVDPKTVVNGSFKDKRDGKTYKTVKIGTQTWMAENLNYKTDGSRCYDGKAENCKKYGRLYTAAVALMACPSGWKLPTGQQWVKLLNVDNIIFKEIGMYTGFSSDVKMNEDPYGFNILPAGVYANGQYRNIGKTTAFWTNSFTGAKTDSGTYINVYYMIRFNPNQVTSVSKYEQDYFSVRCIKK